MSTKITPLDLYRLLTPRERSQFMALIDKSPCESRGHRFKSIGKQLRWFLPAQEKLVCTQCGKVQYV